MRLLKPDYSAALRGRRLLRHLALLSLFLLGLFVLLDHLGCFGYRGDDGGTFDGKRFTLQRVTPRGDLIVAHNGSETEIHLLGVATDSTAQTYLQEHATGKTAILKLEPLESRDAEGRLLAYVYIPEGDCLNVDIVRAGAARADRHRKHSMQAVIEGAESDARKHKRGIWKDAVESRGR